MEKIDSKSKIIVLNGAKHFGNSLIKKLKADSIPLVNVIFASNEIMVHPKVSLANKSVVVIQSIINHDNLVELLLLLNSLKNNNIKSIELIVPYCAYARQDKKHAPNEPISFQMIAEVVTSAVAIKEIVFMDIHNLESLKYFKTKTTNLSALQNIVACALKDCTHTKDIVFVSPDFGGLDRIKEINKTTKFPIAYFRKTRPMANKVKILESCGSDVGNKNCILIDDMIDTGQTIFKVCEMLNKLHAKTITICATHAILSDGADKTLNELIKNGKIKNIYFSNSIESIYEKDIKNKIIYNLSDMF
ncbi:MAG: ribose-phosphate diphosphokinase [Mycoplasmataceae bacterium]|jgi:ribose-phosphate pyrophosphokinase|nr:ribose-phosphate diphosphokinase [Mycoplasmataceae bacterium]